MLLWRLVSKLVTTSAIGHVSILFNLHLCASVQIQHESKISDFGVPGLTAGLQTSFPGGENRKAHVRENLCSNCVSFRECNA